MKTRLIDIADVIRSKNSGPYELTMDIIFKTVEDFERVWNAGVINEALISQVYQIDPDQILSILAFPPAKAIKITIKRPICSGNIGETDVYGAQQHAPLLSLSFDLNQA
jgi:hypothetical protein